MLGNTRVADVRRTPGSPGEPPDGLDGNSLGEQITSYTLSRNISLSGVSEDGDTDAVDDKEHIQEDEDGIPRNWGQVGIEILPRLKTQIFFSMFYTCLRVEQRGVG